MQTYPTTDIARCIVSVFLPSIHQPPLTTESQTIPYTPFVYQFNHCPSQDPSLAHCVICSPPLLLHHRFHSISPSFFYPSAKVSYFKQKFITYQTSSPLNSISSMPGMQWRVAPHRLLSTRWMVTCFGIFICQLHSCVTHKTHPEI